MQMNRRIRQELNPSGEIGTWIEDAVLHTPLLHLQLTRQKPIKRLHSESDNKSERATERKSQTSRLKKKNETIANR